MIRMDVRLVMMTIKEEGSWAWASACLGKSTELLSGCEGSPTGCYEG